MAPQGVEPYGPFPYVNAFAAAGQESSGPAFKPASYHLRSAGVTVRGRQTHQVALGRR